MSIEFTDKTEPAPQVECFNFSVPTDANSVGAIFNAYGIGLAAPNGYFGTNWDAFYDCLMDLQWIEAERIEIVHHKLPNLPKSDLSTYVQILRDADNAWADKKTSQLASQFKQFVTHALIVRFPIDCESQIETLLAT